MGLSEEEELEYLRLLELEDAQAVELDWQRGNLRWKLHAAQRKIYDAIRALPVGFGNDPVMLCSRRFGKSYLICIMALEDGIRNPGNIVRIVGPELQQTIEIVDYHMEKIRADAPVDFIRRRKNGRVWEVGASQIVIGGFDKKNVKRNLGKEAISVYTEEACASKSEEFDYAVREVIGPQLFHTRGRMVHATTPPEDLNHVFITQFVPTAERRGLFFKFTIDDNPMADEAMRKDAIEKSGGEHTTAYKRNYLCEFVREDSLSIIPLFSHHVNVREFDVPAFARWTVAVDFGYARDLSAAALSFWDFRTSEHRIIDALVWDRATSTQQIVRDLLALEARWGVRRPNRVVDEDPRTIADLGTIHGYPCSAPSKDELVAMLAEFNVSCGNGKVVVHPRCEQLISAMHGGLWNKTRTDFERTPLLGHWDSGMAALYGFRAQDRRDPAPEFPHAHPNTHHIPETGTTKRNIFGWDRQFA